MRPAPGDVGPRPAPSSARASRQQQFSPPAVSDVEPSLAYAAPAEKEELAGCRGWAIPCQFKKVYMPASPTGGRSLLIISTRLHRHFRRRLQDGTDRTASSEGVCKLTSAVL